MPRPACLFVLLALTSRVAKAQDSLVSQYGLRPVLGLRVGPPLRAAFNLGLARARYKASPHGGYVGTAIIIEAGSGGGQVSLARVAGNGFSAGRIQLSVVRTWGEPQWVAPRQTFLGAEARLMVGIGIGVGVFARISGTA